MIEVLAGGVQTQIQDGGRHGYRHLGIPTGGAADPLSFALANWMVGNKYDAPALECALGGLHLKFHEDTHIAVAGAEMQATLNGKSLKNFTHAPVDKGDELVLGPARYGCSAYISVAGGIAGEEFLQSVSTYTLANLGGLDGQALKPGDHVDFGGGPIELPQSLPFGFAPKLSRHVVLRTRPGPEFEALTLESRRLHFTESFGATNRMGARLDSVTLSSDKKYSMISGPILPGTLQMPPDGKPILALVDGHCTGGYSRIGQIIRADLWLLGQIAPGTKISFQRCFTEDAPDILATRNALYGSLIDGFQF